MRTLVVGGVGSVGLTFISTFEHLNGFWTILSGARAGARARARAGLFNIHPLSTEKMKMLWIDWRLSEAGVFGPSFEV